MVARADYPPTIHAFAVAHHYRLLRDLSLDQIACVLDELVLGLTAEGLHPRQLPVECGFESFLQQVRESVRTAAMPSPR